jgi:hypothetical protein
MLALPLYASSGQGARPIELAVDELDRMPRVRAGSYYYRSSLCSTPGAMGACANLESTLALQPVFEDSLAPVPSLLGLDYETSPVRVGLYRVRGQRAAAGRDESP